MNISLCLIVKNEIDDLSRCVESVGEAADEIVILDTGSCDGTQDEARRLADVYAESANATSFAAMRNECLAMAQGDWVLFLDADERLPSTAVESIRTCVAAAQPAELGVLFPRYNIFRDGGFYVSRELKLFRRRPDVYFERAINESVLPSIDRAGGHLVPAPAFLNHFGHCRSLDSRVQKANRYLSAFAAAEQEAPGDPFFPAFAGLIHRTLGNFPCAQECMARAMANGGGTNPVIRLFQGHVLRACGRIEEAAQAYEAGLRLQPGDPALLTMVGLCQLAQGQLEAADASFHRAARADPLYLSPLVNIGLCAQARGDAHGALAAFDHVLAVNPALGHQSWEGMLEPDYFRCTHYETPFGFKGVAYHRALAQQVVLGAG